MFAAQFDEPLFGAPEQLCGTECACTRIPAAPVWQGPSFFMRVGHDSSGARGAPSPFASRRDCVRAWNGRVEVRAALVPVRCAVPSSMAADFPATPVSSLPACYLPVSAVRHNAERSFCSERECGVLAGTGPCSALALRMASVPVVSSARCLNDSAWRRATGHRGKDACDQVWCRSLPGERRR